MFTRNPIEILSTVVFLIGISNSIAIGEEFSPIVNFYLNASSEHDCFFIVGSESNLTERIGSFKLILNAHSEPFRKLLQVNEVSDHGDIALPDIEPKIFKDFLICLYGGCDIIVKNLSFEECGKMLYITEKYLVTEVKEKIITRFSQFLPLTLDDMFTALSNPVYLTVDQLNKAVSEKISKNTKEILDDERFLSLDDKTISIILKQDMISVPEIVVWESILKWGINKTDSENGEIIRGRINSLLEFIRFCSMDLKEFCLSVMPTQVFSYKEATEVSIALANSSCPNIPGVSREKRSRYVPPKVQPRVIFDYYDY